nr:MFS transporter [Acidobacteriota bacterium]
PIASALLGWTSWRWLFVFNAPFGLAGLAIGFLSFPKGRRRERRLNVGSTLLNAATFGPIIAGLQALVRGARSAALLLLAWGSVSAWFLVRRELSAEAPLIPFDLLRVRAFALSIYSLVLCITAQAMGFVALAFFLQESLGYSVGQTGPLMAVWPIVNALTSPIAGRLSDRYSAAALATIGLLIFSAGLGCVAITSRGAPPLNLIGGLTICGLGFGLFSTPNTRVVLTSSSADRSGAASGMLAMARTLGLVAGAQGVAICFALSGVKQGAQSALLVGATAALAGAIIGGFRLSIAKDSGPQVRPSAPS